MNEEPNNQTTKQPNSHLFDLLEKILAAEGDTVEVEIPEENFNFLMLRTLREKAKKEKKKMILKPTGEKSRNLITALTENGEPETVQVKGVKKKRKINLRFLKRHALVPLITFLVLLALGGGAYLAIYYLPKAEVILTLKPLPLVKEISITASTAAQEVNVEEGVIPGTSRTSEESGQKTADTTGSTTIGEKAKGPVTLINCSDTLASFSAGAQLKVAGKNLVYSLDSTVSDVPARVGPDCGSKPGSVTASSFGPDYNQGENIYFDFVSGYSNTDYDAYTASGQAITGGSSQQVKVVSSADQTTLLDELTRELTERGKESMASAGGVDEVVVEEAIKSEVVEKNFSHAVGGQTDKLTLNLKMKFTLITYEGSAMQEFLEQALAELVPEGFELFPGETTVNPLDPTLSADKLEFQAKVSALVVPKIDAEKIKSDLAGRNPDSAQEYLSSLGDIAGFELKLWPNLPSAIQRVPRGTKRITVTFRTE
ncbi:hypothetical protein GTO10_02575 [Candidatus Saccharibacteria bacterium]|nr:hypothetical protein [Candidatus Saccharibacteria bacterium]